MTRARIAAHGSASRVAAHTDRRRTLPVPDPSRAIAVLDDAVAAHAPLLDRFAAPANDEGEVA